jgi:cytochrome P450
MALQTFVPFPGPVPDALYGWRKAAAEFIKTPIGVMRRLQAKYGPFAALVQTSNPDKVPPYLFAFGAPVNEALADRTQFADASSVLYPMLTSPSVFTHTAVADLQSMAKADLIATAGSDEQLARYEPAFNTLAEVAIEEWRKHGFSNAFDITQPLRKFARRAALVMTFGFEPEDEPAAIAPLLHDIQANALVLESGGVAAALNGSKRQAQQAVRLLGELVARSQDVAGAPFVFGALAGARAQDGASLTDEELMHALCGIFPILERGMFAATVWALLLLSQHATTMAKAQDELLAALKGKPLTVDREADTPLLRGIVKETLRLFPPKPYGARKSIGQQPFGEWVLPPNAVVIHSPLLTHNDAEVYDKPYFFLPHRYKFQSPSAFEYRPLGDLHPATRLVEFAVERLLAVILQRYRLTVTRDVTANWAFNGVIDPAGSVPMFIVPEGMIYPVSQVKGSWTEFFRMPK